MDGKLRSMTALYLIRGEEILLLFRQGSCVADQMWVGSAGGHFQPDEVSDARACLLRELQEELALGPQQLENLSLRYIALRHTGGEVRQTYYFFASLKPDVPSPQNSPEGTLKWFPLSQTDALPMPFTARHVLQHYRQTGRHDHLLYGGLSSEQGMFFAPLPEC